MLKLYVHVLLYNIHVVHSSNPTMHVCVKYQGHKTMRTYVNSYYSSYMYFCQLGERNGHKYIHKFHNMRILPCLKLQGCRVHKALDHVQSSADQ